MSYLARIHDTITGRFLLNCSVEAGDLHEAENVAIAKAALTVQAQPQDMEVRQLHQCASRRIEFEVGSPLAAVA